jgi:hypothetical protein
LVVSAVVGKRTAEAVRAVVLDFRRRTGHRVMRLITPDEYPAYAGVIRGAYGGVAVPPRTGRRGRPRRPHTAAVPEVTYATVHEGRANNRVVSVSARGVLGAADAGARASASSRVSRSVNTRSVERHNGTDRNRCGREARKRYGPSKDRGARRAATMSRDFRYNLCWPVRTPRIKADGRWRRRAPATAAGSADRVWSVSEWLAYPVVQRK